MKQKILSSLLFVVGGVPLLFTPFILVANIMTMAGERPGKKDFL